MDTPMFSNSENHLTNFKLASPGRCLFFSSSEHSRSSDVSIPKGGTPLQAPV